MRAAGVTSVLPRLAINTALAERILTGFIRDSITKAGMSRAVIGLSGGIDSAVSALPRREGARPGKRAGFAYALQDLVGGQPERCRGSD